MSDIRSWIGGMAGDKERFFPDAVEMDRRVVHLRERLKVAQPEAARTGDDMLDRLLRFQPLSDVFRRAREARGWGQARAARAVGMSTDAIADLEMVVGLFGEELPWLESYAWTLGLGEVLAQWIESNAALAFEVGLPDGPSVRQNLELYSTTAHLVGHTVPPAYVPPEEWIQLARGPLEEVPPLLGAGHPLGLRLLAVVRGIEPTIWRRLDVRDDLTLAQLHEVMQVVMGWNSTHQHAWDVGRKRFGRPDQIGEPGVRDDRRVTLDDLHLGVGDVLTYWYDFGDGWQVQVRVERALKPEERPAVRCLNGRRAGPPDDCGGPPGYQELMAALAGPPNERRSEVVRWLGSDFDPDAFDPADSNAALARRNRRWQPRRP